MRERRTTSLLWRLMALLAVLSLVAAACGDDDDDASTTTAAEEEEGPPPFVVPASCETDDAAAGGTVEEGSTDTSADASDETTDETTDEITEDTGGDATGVADGGEVTALAQTDPEEGEPGTDPTTEEGTVTQTDAVDPLVAPAHPQAGGEFVDLQNFSAGNPDAIDPALARTLQAAQIGYLLFDGLTENDPETAELQPAVAESWQSNDDASEWTFQLRDGVTFSDGEPVLPSSFKCAWERNSQPGIASPTAYHLNFIEGKEAVDAGDTTELSGVIADDENMTLTVRMAAPFADFPSVVTHVVYSPLSKQQVVELGDGEGQAAFDKGVMIGNGPFAMSEPWQEDRYVKLERNDQYWGGINNHLAAVDTLEFRISKDIDSAYNEFEAGQGHTAAIPSGRFAEARGNYPNETEPILNSYFFVINQDDEVLGGEENKLLRQAITIAINRQSINDAAYDGSRRMPTGHTPPGIPGFEEGLCGDLCPETPDIARAQQLLEDWGGELPTEPIKVQFNADAGHDDVAALMIQGLGEIGIPAEPVGTPSETYFGEMAGGACQLCRLGWAWDFPIYDNGLYSLFHSTNIDGGDNFARYDNAEFDAMIEEARATLDPEERRQIYRDAEALMLEDVPTVPINWYNGNIVYRENVGDFILSPLNIVAYDRVTLSS